MEGKKISFGFMKIKKPEKPIVEERKEYIECVEEKSIKVVGGEAAEEKIPLVIPMQPNTLMTAERLKQIAEKVESTIDEPEMDTTITPKEEIPPENETLEEMAIRELMEEAKKVVKLEPQALTVPVLTKPIVDGEKESTLDDYEAIPIQQFGMAMLRGMGWSPSKEQSKYKPPQLRPKGLGLGADKVISENQKKKSKDNKGEELMIVKNSFVKITTGKYNGCYGKVVSLNEDNGRVMVDIPVKKETVSLSEFMMHPVSKSEYDKESKVIKLLLPSRKCVSLGQMELLVEFLEGHRDLARGKRLKSKEASAVTSRIWAECADILNTDTEGDPRTPKQWNKWYTDFKCRLLSRIRQIRQNQYSPGVHTSKLSPLEKRLAVLLGVDSDVVGSSSTPPNELEVSPAHNTFSFEPSDDENISLEDNLSMKYEDFVDVTDTTFTAPTSTTPKDIKESGHDTTAHRLRKLRRSRQLNRQTTSSISELDRSRNKARIRNSRIQVERLMAIGYNKMTEAANRMADAASRMADVVSKSADAQRCIAEELKKINETLQNRNARRRNFSSDEDD